MFLLSLFKTFLCPSEWAKKNETPRTPVMVWQTVHFCCCSMTSNRYQQLYMMLNVNEEDKKKEQSKTKFTFDFFEWLQAKRNHWPNYLKKSSKSNCHTLNGILRVSVTRDILLFSISWSVHIRLFIFRAKTKLKNGKSCNWWKCVKSSEMHQSNCWWIVISIGI